MKKKTTKKAVTKRIPKKYKLEMIFNGITYKKQTDDLAKSIMDLKPDILYTNIFINIWKGEHLHERILTLVNGKKLFNDSDYLMIFLNNLMM